jgi:hypothetical protein
MVCSSCPLLVCIISWENRECKYIYAKGWGIQAKKVPVNDRGKRCVQHINHDAGYQNTVIGVCLYADREFCVLPVV